MWFILLYYNSGSVLLFKKNDAKIFVGVSFVRNREIFFSSLGTGTIKNVKNCMDGLLETSGGIARPENIHIERSF